jgi:CelD/BcsL family acetyltransferase involved in cellulose biosynthesis
MTRVFPSDAWTTCNDPVRGRCHEAADLSVSCLDGLAALERFSSVIDRFNLGSGHHNPFLSSAFLLCYALRNEYHTPGSEERLFLIWEGDRLMGCAPMRRSIDRYRGVRFQFLAPLDTASPGILSAPEDEARVAAALIRYICNVEKGWGMLELVTQRPDSTLRLAVHAAANRKFRARDICVGPHNEISVIWKDLNDYFQSLGKKMRSNVSRQARRLFKAGEIELIIAEGGQAVAAWFDAFCDLERRSWKHGTTSSIERHPRRVRYYREIASGKAGFDPEFIGVVLDGVLIAGLLVGSNASASPEFHRAWCLEMAYDQSRADLGPGQLLLLLAVGRAIEKGHRYLSFLQNFAYFKHRWAADPIDVVNVQLIRRLSRHNFFASLGELRRKLPGRRPQPTDPKRRPQSADSVTTEGDESPEQSKTALAFAPDQVRARELASEAIACCGKGVRRLDRGKARLYLPFNLE